MGSVFDLLSGLWIGGEDAAGDFFFFQIDHIEADLLAEADEGPAIPKIRMPVPERPSSCAPSGEVM